MIEIIKIKNNIKDLSSKISLNIDSIFIQQNNNIDKIFYKPEKLHELRSISKLLVAMTVGIAIDKKMLINGEPISLSTLIYPSIKHIINITNLDNLEKIKKWTIKDLLLHSTGYESQMFSGDFIKDIPENKLLDYALNYDMPYDIGTRFAYNNVEPFIISVLFSEAFNINLSDFINENIFSKMNIFDYKWDNFGKYCAASTGLYLKHSDLHKIAQLLLNDGMYSNLQIIPNNWIKQICSLQMSTPYLYKPERVLPKLGVGYFTFISRDGFIFRAGANGQYIILNREKKLLITILSSEKDMKNIIEILRNII